MKVAVPEQRRREIDGGILASVDDPVKRWEMYLRIQRLNDRHLADPALRQCECHLPECGHEPQGPHREPRCIKWAAETLRWYYDGMNLIRLCADCANIWRRT